MALVYADRVKETSVTTGTGALSLDGAVPGFRTFLAGVGNGNQTYYAISDESDGNWEVGLGTVSGAQLTRDSVLASSNSNALVNFGPNTKTVFATAPAQFFASALDAAAHATINHTGLPGIPAAEAFTALVHAGTDHTGLPGVGDLTVAAHSAVNHTGLPGVGDLTTAAHAVLDHTGIPGVGDLTTIAHATVDHSGVPGVAPLAQGAPATNLLTSPTAFYIVPANTLLLDGDALEFEIWLQGLDNGSTTFTLSFGGVTLLSDSVLAPSNARYKITGKIVRTNASSSASIVEYFEGINTPQFSSQMIHGDQALSWAAAHAFTLQASSTDSDSRLRLVYYSVNKRKAN